MYVDRWGRTDTGKQRLDNQDSIYFAQAGKQDISQAQIDAHGVLLAVADGVGGEFGGYDASQAIVRHLVAAYYNAPMVDPINNLRQAIQEADQLARKEMTYREAATTLVAVIILKNRLFAANIGDSRAYWIRGEQIHQLTEDHTQNGKLARYLVSYPNDVQPDLVQLPDLEVGDRILLCSDGLYDPIPEASEIWALATRGRARQAANRLVKTANRYGGPDNVSVVMARLTEQPPLAGWQIGVIAGLVLLLFILGSMLVSALGSGRNESSIPMFVPTAVILMATPQPTPTLESTARTIDETTTATPSDARATVTLNPSRTPTLTPSHTPIPPTPTDTITVMPTNTPTPTSPPSIVADTPLPVASPTATLPVARATSEP